MKYIPSSALKESGEAIGEEQFAQKSWAVSSGMLGSILTKYAPRKLGQAVDLGAGRGATALALRADFERVIAVDIANYLSDAAKPRVEFARADLNFDRLPVGD